MANSHALTVAVAAHQASEQVGLPECEYALAHAVLYLATSPKSNSVTRALAAVKRALREEPVQAVPPWLRDAHNATSQSLGNGAGYRYSHDFPQAISGRTTCWNCSAFMSPVSRGGGKHSAASGAAPSAEGPHSGRSGGCR